MRSLQPLFSSLLFSPHLFVRPGPSSAPLPFAYMLLVRATASGLRNDDGAPLIFFGVRG